MQCAVGPARSRSGLLGCVGGWVGVVVFLEVSAHCAHLALPPRRLTPSESRDGSQHQGGHNLPAAGTQGDGGRRAPLDAVPARLLSGRTRGRSSADSSSSGGSSDAAGSGMRLPPMPAVAAPHAAALDPRQLDMADLGLRSPRPPGAA